MQADILKYEIPTMQLFWREPI